METLFPADRLDREAWTGYLMFLNGDTISWRSLRQGDTTLSSRETEFVGVRQVGEEVVYLPVGWVSHNIFICDAEQTISKKVNPVSQTK